MSRLYDALERIREKEEEGRSKKSIQVEAASLKKLPSSKGNPWIISTFAVAIVAILALGLWYLRGTQLVFIQGHSGVDTKRDIAKNHTIKKTDSAVSQGKGKTPIKAKQSPPSERATELNDKAVELAKRGEVWEALYLLDKAIKMDPDLEEPYYNTMYCLYKLGLFGALEVYYNKAKGRFGNTPWIRRNGKVLERTGIR